MTALGKLLALLNLLAGLAAVSWAAGLFLDRPAWYDPVPEAVDKGNSPVTFKGLQAEIETLEKKSQTEAARWDKERERLQAALRRARG